MAEVYVSDVVVKAHECGPGDCLKLKDLLDYFQDVAAEHASRLGVGIQTMGKKSELWVLSRLKLGVLRDIKGGERLRLKTYPSGLDLLFAVRQFCLEDASGAMVANGTSYWLLLDSSTFRPMRPHECLPESLLSMRGESFYEDLSKIQRESGTHEVFRVPVRPSDLDVNNHLNNAQYGRYITDVAWELCGGDVRFAELQINYNHQALVGDVVCGGGCLREDGSLYVEGASVDGKRTFFQALGRVVRRS